MEKTIFKFISYLFLLTVAALVCIAYFSTSFDDIRQAKETEANYRKILIERKIKQEALERERKEQEQKIYLTGNFNPRNREDFVLISKEYTTNGAEMYLRQETLESFLLMQNLANDNGINLRIASATRNFNYQKELWNKKWTGVTLVEGKNLAKTIPDGALRFKKILEYSAVPSTSRHHWGTDIDINGAEPAYFETPKGALEYEWLVKNASLFGFCQTYNAGRISGYNEEKWHWSYLPLARDFTEQYKNLIKEEEIKDFDGDEYVPSFDLINNYVLSINPDCI